MNPLAEYSPEDWIVVFLLQGGGFRRMGVSPHVDEKEAIEMARRLLRPEELPLVVDEICGRRHDGLHTNPKLVE